MSCPACFKGNVHDHGSPEGTMETIAGMPCYVAAAPSTSSSKSAIIFLTDAFGLKLVNNKILADQIAAESGMRVILPDIIPGGGAPVSMIVHTQTALSPVNWLDLTGWWNRVVSVFSLLATFIPFMVRAKPSKVLPAAVKFARAVKADLPPGARLGVVGYCWGGRLSTNLCTESAVEGGSQRLIDAQYCAHPSMLKLPDMILDAVTKFKVPYSMAIGDNDMTLSKSGVEALEAELRQKVGAPEANDYEIILYPGCKHGFAIRCDPEDKVEMAAADDTRDHAVAWFKKYL